MSSGRRPQPTSKFRDLHPSAITLKREPAELASQRTLLGLGLRCGISNVYEACGKRFTYSQFTTARPWACLWLRYSLGSSFRSCHAAHNDTSSRCAIIGVSIPSHVQWIGDCCAMWESVAASNKCHSRVRRFGMVFDSPVQRGCMLRAIRYVCYLVLSDMCATSMTLGSTYLELHTRPTNDRTARVRAPSVRIPTCSSSSATVLTQMVRYELLRPVCHVLTAAP